MAAAGRAPTRRPGDHQHPTAPPACPYPGRPDHRCLSGTLPATGESQAMSDSALKVVDGVKVLPEEDAELPAEIVGVMERR